MKEETFKVTGVGKYLSNIMKLAEKNSDYSLPANELKEGYDVGDKIWEYEFFPSHVDLIEEEYNPFDKKAVRVEVDGEIVGYIKKGSSAHVRNLLASPNFYSATVKSMGTGKYKIVTEDENGRLKIENGQFDGCWVHIKIKTKDEGQKENRIETRPAEDTINAHNNSSSGTNEVVDRLKKASNSPVYAVVMIVMGVILSLLSLLILLIYPLWGILGLTFGIGYAVWGIKKKRNSR